MDDIAYHKVLENRLTELAEQVRGGYDIVRSRGTRAASIYVLKRILDEIEVK